MYYFITSSNPLILNWWVFTAWSDVISGIFSFIYVFFVSIFLRFLFYPQIVSFLLPIHKSVVLQLCVFSMAILKTVSTLPFPVICLFSSSGNFLSSFHIQWLTCSRTVTCIFYISITLIFFIIWCLWVMVVLLETGPWSHHKKKFKNRCKSGWV